MPRTPPTYATPLARSAQVRERRISAPSPGKVQAALRAARHASGFADVSRRTTSPGPSSVFRARPSTAMSAIDDESLPNSAEYYGANPPSVRRTASTLGRRARQPLPREFMDGPSDQANPFLSRLRGPY
jgi:hypothetical protein